MIINSLTLGNFRQFCGEKTIITFSTDPCKKVTIIMAESGVGKTTLIQAFQWILYGTSKYSSVLNESIKQALGPRQESSVSASVNLTHANKNFTITRTQIFYKINVKTEPKDSILVVDTTGNDGQSVSTRGRDATKIIKEIMPKDLFPYFFLEGESLTRVGSLMSKGKSGADAEFSNAVKGLLGFNYLYEASRHLNIVCKDYQTEIKDLTSNSKLKENIETVEEKQKTIDSYKERCSQIDKEIEYDKTQEETYSDQISAYGEVEEKQNQTRNLGNELPVLQSRINDEERVIFKKFSTDGLYFILNSLLPKTNEVLKDSDSMDKGITGINVDAINYILEHHECVCGTKIIEGSDEWEKLEEWKTYLPPNNISSEINNFKDDLNFIVNKSKTFSDDFLRERMTLNSYIDSYNTKQEELERLNEQIKNVSVDVSSLKAKEQEYGQKILDLTVEKRIKSAEITKMTEEIRQLEEIQETYKRYDEKIQKLNRYSSYACFIKKGIDKYCERKESEKKIALEGAINQIFADFYKEKIHFNLDSNYGVNIYDQELSDDFTSGGQDVAVALAFIGAIIKVNGEKDVDPDKIEEDNEKEIYPLVMDAPTSNFGMKQMNSFCEIMPKITNQIIVFINDKDGPILLDKMQDQIGKKWELAQIDTYHAKIEEDI